MKCADQRAQEIFANFQHKASVCCPSSLDFWSLSQRACRGTLSWEASEPGAESTHFQGFLPKRKMGTKMFHIIFPDTNGFLKKRKEKKCTV